jgi:hypothetical protein
MNQNLFPWEESGKLLLLREKATFYPIFLPNLQITAG